MTFENSYQVEIKDIGKNNDVTNKAILGYLEDIACLHSAEVGYGPDDTKSKKVVWLLSEWKLKVIKRPHFGDKLKVITWARDSEICSSYRDFKILDKNEEIVAIATSKWIFFDLNTNKIAKIDENILNLYKPEPGNAIFDEIKISKQKQPNNFESFIEYTTKRLDIDMNNHMHNLNYLQLAYEALPKQVYDNKEFNNVRITYKKEVKLDDKIKCFYTREDNAHIVTIKSFDERKIHAIIELC